MVQTIKVKEFSDMTEKIIVKPSPFAHHGDEVIKYDVVQKSKTLSIRNMFERRLLLDVDGKIMYYIDKYTYLNAYLIRNLLASEMECKPEFCRERLNHLVKLGLLSRFRITHGDKFGKTHASSYFYSFSEKGRSLYRKEKKRADAELPDAGDVLRQVAFNQLYIMLYLIYGPSCVNQVYRYGNKAYDGQVQFSSMGRNTSFHIMSLRTNEQWKETYVSRLLEGQKQKIPCKAYIVLCETELQALEAERYRKSVADVSKLNICYLCDHATNSPDGIFSHLIMVKPENNYSSYDICSIPIDGSRRGVPVEEQR